MNINKKAKLNLNKIQLSNLLRITDPFLMIDEVKNIIPGKSGDGYKHLKKNSWFYKCHFVNEPIMPGTLQIESIKAPSKQKRIYTFITRLSLVVYLGL